MKKFILLIGTASLFLMSCNVDRQRGDFIGEWKASDGARIYLYEDSTCLINDLDVSKISDIPARRKFVTNGVKFRWKFLKEDKIQRLGNIYIYQDMTYPDTINVPDTLNPVAFYMQIVGEGILLGNKPPWYIRYMIDIDTGESYKFFKVSK